MDNLLVFTKSDIFREKLPLVMQNGCDEIYPALLHHTVGDKDACEKAYDEKTPYVGRVHGPVLHDNNSK